LCAVPDGQPFKIQVKGISNPNGFWVQKAFFEAHLQQELFLIIVLVPPAADTSLRFFVLSHSDAQQESSKMPTRKRDGRLYQNGSGLNWGSIKPYEDKWDKLPMVAATANRRSPSKRIQPRRSRAAADTPL